MVLTAVTVGAAFVNLGSFNFPVAISIAITKATLVILFFMHVKYSSRLTKMIVAMSFFFLFILFGLTLTDYLSRGWHTSPRGSGGAGTQVGISTTTPERTRIEPVGTEPEPGKNEPASAAH
jgi:cytochrome c oxidase subunit 4